MNEEYLWDKSGEPDPEIQQLETILGTLRYQPKPLELPDVIQPASQRQKNYLPWLAIAATLLLAMLAGIVWLSFRSKGLEKKYEAYAPTPAVQNPAPTSIEVPTPNRAEAVNKTAPTPRQRRDFVTRHRPRPVQLVPSQEALLAKEQLMSALKLASEKLNLAEKKVQGPTPNQIRNQHKVG